MASRDDSDGKGSDTKGRNTTLDAERYSSKVTRDESVSKSLELEGTGIAEGLDDLAGFRQPTAMFDRGEFLGELGEVFNEAPETRAKVEAENPPRGFRLIVVAGPSLGTEWSFKQSQITIGRSAENEIDFADIAVSRQHTRICFDDDHFLIKDLGSNNGTLLNGIRITEETLHSGDEIIIGERTLRFVELNDAPSTSAAQPNLDSSSDDLVDPPEKDGEDEELSDSNADQSQLNVAVIPRLDGPSIADSVSESVISVIRAPPKRTGLKVIGITTSILLLVIALVFTSVRIYQNYQGTTPEARERLARTYFLQAVALTGERRCGDALILLDEVLSIKPEYSRAKEYRAYCSREIESYRDLERAKQLQAKGLKGDALAVLAKIPRDSQYAASVASFSSTWSKNAHEDQWRGIEAAMRAKNYSEARDLIEQFLQDSPRHPKALRLKAKLIQLTETPRPSPEIEKPLIPSAIARAVDLYREGKVSQAIDAVDLARSEKAANYLERLKRLQKGLPELQKAHRQKAAGDVIALAPELLKTDRRLGFGKGVIRRKIQRFYADGLYLKGLEAFNDDDLPKSYKLFRKSIKARPDHKLSTSYLETLSRKARVLYYEAYVLKDSNKPDARRLFKKVTSITSKKNQFHKLAKKWLSKNR